MRTRAILIGASALLFGCSGDDAVIVDTTTDAASSTDGTASDTSMGIDSAMGSDSAPTDAGPDSRSDAASADAADGADAGRTLTIKNYFSWCSVTVNGGSASTSASQTLTVPAGTVVTLHGDTANSAAFVWSYWVGVDIDAATHDTNMSAAVTVNANMTVQACCPLVAAPTTPCPAP